MRRESENRAINWTMTAVMLVVAIWAICTGCDGSNSVTGVTKVETQQEQAK